MQKATLFIAPLGARNKREAIFKEIISLYPENNFSPVLYLAPNNFVLTEAKRQFFSYLKKVGRKSVCIPFQAWTIKRLAVNLHETFNPVGACPGQPQGVAPTKERTGNIISEHMRTLILCGILKEKNIGYASLLSDLFRKIRHYIPDKDLSRLTDEIRQLIFEEKTRDRAVKAIEILQLYEKFIEEKKLIDTEDVLKDVGAGLCACPGQPHRVAPTIVIDGFFDPTPLEFEIIKALAENADRSLILAEEDTEMMRYFLSRKEGITAKKLEGSVHRGTTGYYSYNSIEEEVEGIAKNIKKLIFDGVKPWEITVCFPSLLQYLPMLRRIFNKHGIPASISEYSLSAAKPIALLEEMITCIENDYPRNDFLSLLTSPCLPAIHDAVKMQAVTLSYSAGIIKGRESWLSIEGVLKSSSDDVTENVKERITEFQKGIRPVIDALENIRKAHGMSAFADAFESALDRFGFFDYLKDEQSFYGDRIAEGIKSQFSELRQFAGLFRTSLQAEDAGFYLRHLLSDLTASDENVDGVKVLTFELAAAIESKALFFGGVTEGSFPSRPGIDPVLPEKFKKTIGLPHLEYYLERQKLYFTRLLNASTFDPYLSCPSADGDKIFLPSPFLDWEKMIVPASRNIFTEEDVLVREGSALKFNNKAGPETYFDAKAIGLLRGRIGTMSKKYFRVTDLDYYRKCPFKFYLEKILGLEIEEPPRFEVEYRQWGNLAHKTMEYLFKDKNRELDDFEKRLLKALEKSLKEIPIGEFWSDVTKEIFRNLLPLLKKQETEIRMQGFSPYKVEEKIEAEINGIRLKGKIDRVDRKVGANGRSPLHETRNSVIILDYKTGSIDRKSLQLPLYARMWQECHSEQVEGVGYYSLKEGEVTWYPSKKNNMEEYIQEALQETAALIEQMKKGMFPAEPGNPNECRNCNHGALCERD
jgi:ATP-dependent helicase/DNAse subunit B